MTSLNEFIDPDLNANEIQHSSGYVAPDGAGGGAGGLSIEKRRALLTQPRIVGHYGQSQLGRRYGALKARAADQKKSRAYDANTDTFEDDAKVSNRHANNIKDARKVDKTIERRQHFIEPSSRPKPTGYNPYA